MASDLISRSALLKKKTYLWDEAIGTEGCVLVEDIENAPAVDAGKMMEQLELVKRQRDALMSEVAGHCWACKNAKPSEIGRSLFTCEFLPSVGMIRSKCEHWEWRGLCKENGGVVNGVGNSPDNI